MINNLQRGDEILTAGGILGKVAKLEADTGLLLVEIAPEVRVKIKKETVSQVMISETRGVTTEKKVVASENKGKTKKKNAKN